VPFAGPVDSVFTAAKPTAPIAISDAEVVVGVVPVIAVTDEVL
jgi:hypothetical protein